MGRVKRTQPRRKGTAKSKADAERDRIVAELEQDIIEMRADGRRDNALIGAQKLRAQLLGLDAPPPPPRQVRRSTGDHLTDHLRDLRMLLTIALERGSVDSAARLTSQIADCIERIEARDAARQAAEMAAMTEEQVVEALIQAVLDLPLPLRLRVAGAVAA